MDFLEYFQLEIAAQKKLSHPNILKMIEHGQANYNKNGKKARKIHYIIYEYACYGELYDVVARSSCFSDDDVRFIMQQLLDVLDYTHKNGFAHLDIKLENVLINSKCELKLADFGFSRPIADSEGQEVVLDMFCGTKNYMAPEFHVNADNL